MAATSGDAGGTRVPSKVADNIKRAALTHPGDEESSNSKEEHSNPELSISVWDVDDPADNTDNDDSGLGEQGTSRNGDIQFLQNFETQWSR